MKRKKRIVITGGHHNSALVVAEELRRRGYEVIWFGHKFTMRGDKKPGAEYREVTRTGFRFVEIKAAKIHRSFHLANLVRFPLGFIQSFFYLLKFRPALILSFGGYLAVPVVFYGWFLMIPVVTHEQTVVYGLANRLIDHFAKKILVSWKSSLKHFSAKKAVLTGLPLRKEIFTRAKGRFTFKNNLPAIYITGGKQGSHTINQAVMKALPDLLGKYNLIHQYGGNTLYNDFAQLVKARKQLSAKLRQRYTVQDYFFRDDIGQVLAAADLVVGRSGAHITYELAVLGKPAIFIPIPWSSADEQTKNAQLLVGAGIAEILPQKELTSASLVKLIDKMIANLGQYRKNSPKARRLVKLDAAKKVADLVEEMIENI